MDIKNLKCDRDERCKIFDVCSEGIAYFVNNEVLPRWVESIDIGLFSDFIVLLREHNMYMENVTSKEMFHLLHTKGVSHDFSSLQLAYMLRKIAYFIRDYGKDKIHHALINNGEVGSNKRLEEVYWELVNSVEEEKIFDMLSNLGILEYGVEQHLISAEQVKLLRENKKATTVNMMLTIKGYHLERFYRASLHNPKPYDILGYEYVKELLSDLSVIAIYYL